MDPSATGTAHSLGSVEERRERGRQARTDLPRSSHGDWAPAADRPDPIGILEAQAETRVPELVPIRYGRMMVSPFAFYRGAAAVMAADLAGTPMTGIHVQLCGDAHMSNFGGFASPERTLVFDLNDFDETLPGPWELDLKRLVASVEIAGRERGLDDEKRRSMVGPRCTGTARRCGASRGWAISSSGTRASTRARSKGRCRPSGAGSSSSTVRKAGAKARRRTPRARSRSSPNDRRDAAHHQRPAADRAGARTASGRRGRSDRGSDARPDRAVRAHSRAAIGGGSSNGSASSTSRARSWASAASARAAGSSCCSGRDDGDPLFLQCKEAQPSVLEPVVGQSPFPNQGQRVVEGQRMMQASSDIFLGWIRTDRASTESRATSTCASCGTGRSRPTSRRWSPTG